MNDTLAFVLVLILGPGCGVNPCGLGCRWFRASRVSAAPERRSSFANSAARGIPEVFNVSPDSSGDMSYSITSVRTESRGPLYAVGAGDEGLSGKASSKSAGAVLVWSGSRERVSGIWLCWPLQDDVVFHETEGPAMKSRAEFSAAKEPG